MISAQIRFGVKKRQTYYVAAAAYPDGILSDRTGAYDLTFRATYVKDDYSDNFDKAKELALKDGITATIPGSIETLGDEDVFSFTAPSTRGLLVRCVPIGGSSLFSHLYAYDESGGKIADLNSDRLPFNITKGKKYFLKIAAAAQFGAKAKNKRGAYKLTFLTYIDDYSSNLGSGAAKLKLNPKGVFSASGSIEVHGDADYFQFTAAKSGPITIDLKRTTS